MQFINDLKFRSPAKINLFLEILSKRKDNYHNLLTDIVPINFWDEFIIKHSNKKILIKNYNATDDLILAAIELLEKKTNKKFYFKLEIKKNIPIGSGLGGASSNASAILTVFNDIFNLKLPQTELLKIGLELGADVPFFLYKKQLRLGSIGEKVISDIDIPSYYLILLHPNFKSLTSEAFKNCSLVTGSNLPKKYTQTNIKKLQKSCFYNFLIKKYPELEIYNQYLLDTKPLLTQLSGSGSSLYAIYKNKQDSIMAFKQLKNLNQNFTLHQSKILKNFNFYK